MKLNIKKFIIIPIIMLCVFAIVDLPKSHAKYIKTGDFSYDVKLKSIELSNNDNLSVKLDNSSTYLDAIYNVSFKRNDAMYEDPDNKKSDTKDTYKITLKDNKNKCSIVNGSITSPNGDNFQNSVWYTSLNTNDTVSFQVKCNVVDDPKVDNDKEYIYLDLKVEETIQNYQGNNDTTFTYFEHQNAIKLSEYYTGDRDPSGQKDSLYQEAVKKLRDTYQSKVSSQSLTILMQYFNTMFVDYPTAESINVTDDVFREKAKGLKGFAFNENGGNHNYIFGLNFLGYAYTWDRDYHTSEKSHYQFAFSVGNPTDRNNIFIEYLNQYGTETLKANNGIDKIMNYINSYSGKINDAFNNKIYEIRPEVVDASNNLIVLHFYDTIITSIDNKFTSVDEAKKIDNSLTNNQTAWNQFMAALRNSYPAVLADNNEIYWKIYDTFTDVNNPGEIGTSLLTNVGKSTFTEFSDYFVIKGISKNIVLNIYSDANNKNYTYFRVFEITSGNKITLAYPTATKGNLSKQIQAINEINQINGAPQISGFGSPTASITDTNGVVHTIYEVNNVTYDFHSSNGIDYITFTA
ncbi:MAG: hypothetical protein HFJ17_03400 [Clostridia bacterium]|nr:hypothetical protein [Clostridia bacterium]